MNPKNVFIAAVSKCAELPVAVRKSAATVQGIRTSTFDASYLEFLDTQIELNARGDQWSDCLRRRREGLAPWCDVPLIDGTIAVGVDDYTVEVDPQTYEVVYWEKYEGMRDS
ncbi:hypothetical protein [Adhaeretor mobilis]|uniref:Uncharacterized protein n=1 Tax=Adhaeretor mobilis TaxID=1930276 RepID=A0A517MT78_9BACT|nr:hypothetical protein [Adhaeretor mobilis]QDS98086.1 hypothetical protein HG15A2_13580 [Adhaeretor mobilis]